MTTAPSIERAFSQMTEVQEVPATDQSPQIYPVLSPRQLYSAEPLPYKHEGLSHLAEARFFLPDVSLDLGSLHEVDTDEYNANRQGLQPDEIARRKIVDWFLQPELLPRREHYDLLAGLRHARDVFRRLRHCGNTGNGRLQQMAEDLYQQTLSDTAETLAGRSKDLEKLIIDSGANLWLVGTPGDVVHEDWLLAGRVVGAIPAPVEEVRLHPIVEAKDGVQGLLPAPFSFVPFAVHQAREHRQ